MKIKVLLIAICLLVTGIFAQQQEKICLGYIADWTFSSQSDLQRTDFKKLTHINFAFFTINPGNQYKPSNGNTNKLTMVRNEIDRQGANSKLLISIGGWGAGHFSEMAASDTYRKAFASHCKWMINQYRLDGIDLDWEYPGSSAAGISSSPNDRANFTRLVRTIRDSIGSTKLLTMAGGASAHNGIEGAACAEVMDFVNVMNYDYGQTNHADFQETIRTCNNWANSGWGKSKVNIGLPFYARSTGNNDWIEYRAIVPRLMNGSATRLTTAANESYCYIDGVKISFDTPEQIRKKVVWAVENGFRGAMTWELSQDLNNDLLNVMWSNLYGDGSYNSPNIPIPNIVTNPFSTPNLARGKNMTASSSETQADFNVGDFPASNAADGNTTTRWSSLRSDNQWIMADLGKEYAINGVRLIWEAAFARSYRVEYSTDNETWTTASTQNNSDGGIDIIEMEFKKARYIRVSCTQRATAYGYSLFEFEVYGVEPIAIPGTFNSTNFTFKSGEITATGTGDEAYVGQLINNSRLEYLVNVSAAGIYKIAVNTATVNSSANQRVITIYEGDREAGKLNVVNNGDWFAFSPMSMNVELDEGLNTIALVSNGAVNIQNIEVSSLAEGEMTAELAFADALIVYSAAAKTPALNVKVGNQELSETDYNVEYSNNINAGTATAAITGKGTFAGKSAVLEFSILKKEIVITLDPKEYTVNFGDELPDFSENITVSGFVGTDNWSVFGEGIDESSVSIHHSYTGINGGSFPLSLSSESNFKADNYTAVFDNDGLRLTVVGNEVSIIGKPLKSDGIHGIFFKENIVSDKAEISVKTPKEAAEVKITIYDMTGNVVFSCRDIRSAAANKTDRVLTWDLTNNIGRKVANGSYLVVVEAAGAGTSRQTYHYSAKFGVKR